jgi:hypothetical protein
MTAAGRRLERAVGQGHELQAMRRTWALMRTAMTELDHRLATLEERNRVEVSTAKTEVLEEEATPGPVLHQVIAVRP